MEINRRHNIEIYAVIRAISAINMGGGAQSRATGKSTKLGKSRQHNIEIFAAIGALLAKPGKCDTYGNKKGDKSRRQHNSV